MAEFPEKIIWQAPEFKYRYKDVSWYWISVIAASILALIAIWQKNLLFVVFVIIAEITIIFWAKQIPQNLHFKIDKKGVYIDKIRFYSYEDLAGFHISEEDGEGELILKTKRKFHPFTKILLENCDIPKIKEFLKERLEEIEYEPSLADHIGKMIGF